MLRAARTRWWRRGAAMLLGAALAGLVLGAGHLWFGLGASDRGARVAELLDRHCLPYASHPSELPRDGLEKIVAAEEGETWWLDHRSALAVVFDREGCRVTDAFAHLTAEERARALSAAMAWGEAALPGTTFADLSSYPDAEPVTRRTYFMYRLSVEQPLPTRPMLAIFRYGTDTVPPDPFETATTFALLRADRGDADA